VILYNFQLIEIERQQIEIKIKNKKLLNIKELPFDCFYNFYHCYLSKNSVVVIDLTIQNTKQQ
jgi:hypothetical protein